MVNRFERFLGAITEINRYWHQVAAEEMKQYGLKGPFALYLVVLSRNSAGLTSAQLCEACDRNKADISRAVAAMEEKGLVVREANNGSAYRARILLTEAGKNAAERVRKVATAAVEYCGKDMSEEDRAVFYNALDGITANLKKISKEGIPQA